ncbi:MAG: DUF3341 domain-containing protein [Anaerolineales bacterium]
MTEQIKLLALFSEIDPAAHAIDALTDLGIDHGSTLGGAIFGGLVGIFLGKITPNLYKVYVGGKLLAPGAPTAVVLFEMIMLFMLIATFLGVFLESVLPSYEKKEYTPELSAGDIAIIIDCAADQQANIEKALTNAGAKMVRNAERQLP